MVSEQQENSPIQESDLDETVIQYSSLDHRTLSEKLNEVITDLGLLVIVVGVDAFMLNLLILGWEKHQKQGNLEVFCGFPLLYILFLFGLNYLALSKLYSDIKHRN